MRLLRKADSQHPDRSIQMTHYEAGFDAGERDTTQPTQGNTMYPNQPANVAHTSNEQHRSEWTAARGAHGVIGSVSIGNPIAARPQPEIERELQALASATSNLQSAVSDLESKLSPALMSQNPTGVGLDHMNEAVESAIGALIQQERNLVNVYAANLRALTSRLAV